MTLYLTPIVILSKAKDLGMTESFGLRVLGWVSSQFHPHVILSAAKDLGLAERIGLHDSFKPTSTP